MSTKRNPSERQVWVPGTRAAMNLAAKSVPFGNVPCAHTFLPH
ncbi:hypothetical protein [Mycolicibacterium elephantis]